MGHIRLGTHLFLFTFTLYLCKHEAAVQTQTWASEKSGQFQESRIGMIVLLLLAFPTPPTPPDAHLDCPSPSSWPPGPSQPSRPTQVSLLGEVWSSLALWLPCSSPATLKSVHHLIISSAALLLYYWNLCFISPTKAQIL